MPVLAIGYWLLAIDYWLVATDLVREHLSGANDALEVALHEVGHDVDVVEVPLVGGHLGGVGWGGEGGKGRKEDETQVLWQG
jgi:hypothetical protein